MRSKLQLRHHHLKVVQQLARMPLNYAPPWHTQVWPIGEELARTAAWLLRQ